MSKKAIMVRLDEDRQSKLEEIKKYHAHSSDVDAIRKSIDDAYRLLQIKKKNDERAYQKALKQDK